MYDLSIRTCLGSVEKVVMDPAVTKGAMFRHMRLNNDRELPGGSRRTAFGKNSKYPLHTVRFSLTTPSPISKRLKAARSHPHETRWPLECPEQNIEVSEAMPRKKHVHVRKVH